LAKWPPPDYQIRVIFHAPLSFVFRWCTDYSAGDHALLKSGAQRKVVEKGPKRRVFEDLHDSASGWGWTRWVIALRPPDTWHADSVGNYCAWSLDYKLVALGGDRTEMTLRGRRRPMVLGSANPARAPLERGIGQEWRQFGRELERDYRRNRRK
jgi:hypothetical protein